MRTAGTESSDSQKQVWSYSLLSFSENFSTELVNRVNYRESFAKEHGATILVFEHLANFKPEKGKYSKRANSKRSYWLRGKIFRYSKYKAWNEGIITSRVNPRNTSREHFACGSLIARYDATKAAEGYTPGAPLMYCAVCDARDNADRNASLNIGKRLLARYQQTPLKEKPHALLRRAERSVKTGGVTRSQDAKRARRPSTVLPRHGSRTALGTTQEMSSRVVEPLCGIPTQLWLFAE